MKRIFASVALIGTLTACGISQQQEVEMGQDYARQINAQLPIVGDAEVNRYINVLGDSIARLSDERNLEWQFFVVNSKEVNAFAVPGGYVYVNRVLIERADNLSMLSGVLAHEIAHVTERHSIHQMEKAQTANVGVTLACVLLHMTPAECIHAITINVAASLGLDAEVGTLHPGKRADFVALDLPNHRALGYAFGGNPVAMTVKDGRPVATHVIERGDVSVG